MRSSSIIALLAFVFFSICCNAQSRFPINPSSKWRVDHIRNGVSDEEKHESGDDISTYYLDGDTLIGANRYFKLYKSGISFYDTPFPYSHVYKGALRDENNKFFYVVKNEKKEELLYDFNTEVDDTIQVPYDGIFEEKIVSSIDTLSDGRKLIHFNPRVPIMGCGDQYIIEGIGGSGGLLEGPACNHFWTNDNHLVCFIQDNLMEYHDNNPQYNCEIIQPKSPYIDSTCVWRVDKQKVISNESDYEKIIYYISGDTLIANTRYLKLYKSGYQLLIRNDGTFFSGYHDALYMGALRETDQELFILHPTEKSENLLFNFECKSHQTIEGEIYAGDTVYSIGKVIDNRKIIYLSENYWEHFIVQGIGSDKGLLETREENSVLVCFTKNGNSIYYNGTGSDCIPSFTSFNFCNSDKIEVIPSTPKVGEPIKLVVRFCYPVSYNHPWEPSKSDCANELADNTFTIQYSYLYDDLKNKDPQQMLIPYFDTIQIGSLDEGYYSVDLSVNTIHQGTGEDYIAERDKSLYAFFEVAANSTNYDPLEKPSIKVYSLIETEPAVVIENFEKNLIIHSVALLDVMGRKLEETPIPRSVNQQNIQIDLNYFSKGIFMLRLDSNQGPFTKKIILP